eukprot:403362096
MNGNQERQATCPECEIVSTQPEEMKESPKIMKYLIQLDQLTIICDEHQSKTTAKYCLKCETPVCIECEIGTHKDHNIIDLKQSKFVTYTENVKNLIDEYSTHNLKSKLDKYAYNEIQINSSHFKTMISKIQRMLGYLVDEEERIKIDLPTCLGEPQNDPQIFQKNPNVYEQPIAAGNISNELTQNDIKQMINESQSILREEFKQTLEAFENALIKKEKILTDQINLRINDMQSEIARQLQQYKEEIKSDFDKRFKEVVKENEINQKLLAINQKYDKLAELVQEIKGNLQIDLKLLNDQIAEIHTKTDSIKQQSQDQISHQAILLLEFQEKLNTNIESINIAHSNSQLQNDVNDLKQNEAFVSQLAQDKSEDIAQEIPSDPNKLQFYNLVQQEINKTDSSLLKSQLIKGGIDKKFKLLFRGSTHGFTASQFHELCDNQGPTAIHLFLGHLIINGILTPLHLCLV